MSSLSVQTKNIFPLPQTLTLNHEPRPHYPLPMASPLPTALVYDPAYKRHLTGPGHPESPARCDAAMKGIAAAIPDTSLLRIEPRPATEDQIALCHSRPYIETAKRDIAAGMGKGPGLE